MDEQTTHVFSMIKRFSGTNSLLSDADWAAVASEALAGSAPAQYIVGAAYEKIGDTPRAEQWLQHAASQGYPPAISELSSIRRRTTA